MVGLPSSCDPEIYIMLNKPLHIGPALCYNCTTEILLTKTELDIHDEDFNDIISLVDKELGKCTELIGYYCIYD